MCLRVLLFGICACSNQIKQMSSKPVGIRRVSFETGWTLSLFLEDVWTRAVSTLSVVPVFYSVVDITELIPWTNIVGGKSYVSSVRRPK